MLTPEQNTAPLNGLTAQDGLVAIQVIKRLLKTGQVEDVELAPLAVLRSRLVQAFAEATGINIDQPAESAGEGKN